MYNLMEMQVKNMNELWYKEIGAAVLTAAVTLT
jgi:hypothetical protein